MKDKTIKTILLIIIFVLIWWLSVLSLFVILDTIYDRKMHRLDMQSDEMNIEIHEKITTILQELYKRDVILAESIEELQGEENGMV